MGAPLKFIHIYILYIYYIYRWILNQRSPSYWEKMACHGYFSTHMNGRLPNPFIQVRTNFKVAFLNEFRKDARGALTAYVKAYELLLKAIRFYGRRLGNWGSTRGFGGLNRDFIGFYGVDHFFNWI